jgi:REP element-mobilizing transposase RayT
MFTILEEGDKAMAADGNHLFAVINVPEKYSNLCEIQELAKKKSKQCIPQCQKHPTVPINPPRSYGNSLVTSFSLNLR